MALGSVSMAAPDPRIVLRGDQIGLANDPIVDYPEQGADYWHTDGTVWIRQNRWRVAGGARLRVYDLQTRIMLRDRETGDLNYPVVDHPGQPADYVHTDGTVWTWLGRWRLVGGVRDNKGLIFDRIHVRVYDRVLPGTDPN